MAYFLTFAPYLSSFTQQCKKTMKKHLVKSGRKIIGFVYSDSNGQHWYAFGKPSQSEYISFACRSLEHGIACIEMYRPIGHY